MRLIESNVAETEHAIKLLELYYAEWKFRVENFWKRLIQFFVIIFFVSTFPITVNLWNGLYIPGYQLIFPCAGILMTFLFLWFALSDATRINSSNLRIKTIIRDVFPERYNTTSLASLFSDDKPAASIFKPKIDAWFPIVLAIFELIISTIMIILIQNGALADAIGR